jgi:hypothetical protein
MFVGLCAAVVLVRFVLMFSDKSTPLSQNQVREGLKMA